MMDSIDNNAMQLAAEKLIQLQKYAIHTVTVTLNGAHGGADVIVEGVNADMSGWKETFVIK